jgi:hypothetical protein
LKKKNRYKNLLHIIVAVVIRDDRHIHKCGCCGRQLFPNTLVLRLHPTTKLGAISLREKMTVPEDEKVMSSSMTKNQPNDPRLWVLGRRNKAESVEEGRRLQRCQSHCADFVLGA